MVEASSRRSPLASLKPDSRGTAAPGEAGVLFRERAFVGKINLRGKAADSGFMEGATAALGFAPPKEPNTVAGEDKVKALWLGPDEWLILTPTGEEQDLLKTLRRKLAGRFAAITDISDSRAVISVGGTRARDVLAKGCGLDLHPRAFGRGRCAQSLLARIPIILHQTEDTPSFDILVVASFAENLWEWLEDAAAEFGFAVIE